MYNKNNPSVRESSFLLCLQDELVGEATYIQGEEDEQAYIREHMQIEEEWISFFLNRRNPESTKGASVNTSQSGDKQ